MADQWQHFDNYILGNCAGEILYNDFCFGGRYGLALGNEPEADGAPSGVAFGVAFDQNTQDVHVEQIAAGGFPVVDGQFVTVGNTDYPDSAYFYLGPRVTGDLNVEQSDLWGNPRCGMVVEGGSLVLDDTSFRNPGAQAFDVTGGDLQATALIYGQNKPLGTEDAIGHISIEGAILPAPLQQEAQGRDWRGVVFSP
jgi:hypothetical protein